MPKISNEIKKALDSAIAAYGNITQLAKEMGIAHSTVLFWQNGKTKSISGQLWRTKISPILLPFMDGAYPHTPNTPVLTASETKAKYNEEPKPEKKEVLHEADIIDVQLLHDYDPSFDALDKFVKKHSTGKVTFAREVKPGYFALNGISDRGYPMQKGTSLLIGGLETAQNSELVLARIHTGGEIVLRTLVRMGTRIRLQPAPNARGKAYEWDINRNPRFLHWMYPVLEANVSFRKSNS